MPNSKKHHRKAVEQAAPASPAEPSGTAARAQEKTPWANEKTTPDTLPDMLANPPESRIGERISHCRRSLGLSVEALARFTRRFDAEGISRTSILRYEAGKPLPGARELRVLSEALAAPVQWLLFGTKDPGMQSPLEAELDRWLSARLGEHHLGTPDIFRDMQQRATADNAATALEKRRRWLWEDKQPPPKS